MVEMMGAITSGISLAELAAQVVKSVSQLRAYWIEIQDASRDIQDLGDDIEVLRLILSNMEEWHRRRGFDSNYLDSTPLKLSFDHCRSRALHLRRLVDDLSTQMKRPSSLRRKLGAARVLTLKKHLKKCKESLRDATRHLMFSYQWDFANYVIENQKVYHFDITQVIAESNTTLLRDLEKLLANSRSSDGGRTTPKDKVSLDEYGLTSSLLIRAIGYGWYRYYYGSSQGTKRTDQKFRLQFRAHYEPPKWLSDSIWELYGFRATSGWKFSLETYRLVPSESPVFHLTIQGDIRGLQALFSSGQASPFDRDSLGITPLQCALFWTRADVARFLLDQGADVNAENNFSQSSLMYKYGRREATYATDDDLQLTQLLLDRNCHIIGFEDPNLTWLIYMRTPPEPTHQAPEIAHLILKEVQACGLFPSVDVCLDVCMAIIQRGSSLGGQMIRKVLAFAKLTIKDLSIMLPKHPLTGHYLARWIGVWIASMYTKAPLTDDERNFRRKVAQDWAALFIDIFSESPDSDLNNTEWQDQHSGACTPLRLLFLELCQVDTLSLESLLEVMSQTISMWLNCISSSGIDLSRYLTRENDLYLTGSISRQFEIRRVLNQDFGAYAFTGYFIRLIGIEHGSSSVDCRFWWSEASENHIDGFWQSVEGRSSDQELDAGQKPEENDLDHLLSATAYLKVSSEEEFAVPGAWVSSLE